MVHLEYQYEWEIAAIINREMKLIIHFQRLHLEVCKYKSIFHPKRYWVCDYIPMLGLKLNYA